jgi:protein-L-isoaspartate O-methyltransferase
MRMFTLLDQAKSHLAATLDGLHEQKCSMTISRMFASAAEQKEYDERLREIAVKQADAEARWEALTPWSAAVYAFQYPDVPG